MKVHDCHDENAIRGCPIEKRVRETGNDDPTDSATKWSTNFGKVLDSGVGSLDQSDEVLSQISSLGLVARRGLNELRSRLVVELDSAQRSLERTSAMTWSAGIPLA